MFAIQESNMKAGIYTTIALIMMMVLTLTGCAFAGTPQQAQNSSSANNPSGTQNSFVSTAQAPSSAPGSGWQESFDISACTMVTTGKNDYFILEPGYQLVLEGGQEVLHITVLDETMEVDGMMTRVVEEREWRNGELIEVSRNFFAMCDETHDVYYFGEEVDMFQAGQLSSHSGAWLSGEGDARFGLIMPGDPKVGMKYYQEVAPGVAMDRAEILSLDAVVNTPAGEFSQVLETGEGTALNLLEREIKTYAPGIGLIQDAKLLLTGYGFIESQ
jgi:hypothetical protein